jgi:hypothetical protein
MLALLGTIVSSILGGGATGLLGVVFQRFFDYKNRQLDIQLQQLKNDHDVKMKEADAAIMAQEWAARTRVAEVETAGASDVAESQAFAASYQLEPQRYSSARLSRGQQWVMVILDFMRGIVRPGLTIYLCALTTMVYVQAKQLLGNEDLTSAEALEMMKLIIGTILYLTTTVTLWWFGTRNKAKQGD